MKKLLMGFVIFMSASIPVMAYECPMGNPYHQLINQENPVPQDYVAGDLVIPKVSKASSGDIQKNYMEVVAGSYLEKMFEDAKVQGIHLTLVSAYRDYNRQTQLYNNAVRNNGVNQKGSAKPGTSEHQSGLAVDVNSLYQSFGNTKEGKWLEDNAHKYGYIIRYPKGKESITGYMYEPWHLRYVGQELAEKLHNEGKVMEELDTCCNNYSKQFVSVYGDNSITPLNLQLIRLNDVFYIKLRHLQNLIGLEVHYNSGEAICRGNNITTSFNLIQPNSFVNAPFNFEDSTYVPLREFLARLNFEVDYSQNQIRITRL